MHIPSTIMHHVVRPSAYHHATILSLSHHLLPITGMDRLWCFPIQGIAVFGWLVCLVLWIICVTSSWFWSWSNIRRGMDKVTLCLKLSCRE